MKDQEFAGEPHKEHFVSWIEIRLKYVTEFKKCLDNANQTRMGQAVEAARLIIEKECAPTPTQPDKVAWDEAIERLQAHLATAGNRPGTISYYLKMIRIVRKMYRE